MKHRIDFSNKKDAIKRLSDRIITAEKHIDGIQVDLLELEKPWHKNISVIISVLAFIFSLGTTAVSAYWTYLQDINSNRTLLLSLIQQIRILAERSIEIQIDGQIDTDTDRWIDR